MNETELRQKTVRRAAQYLGAREADGSHRPIIDRYNAAKPAGMYTMSYTDPWCAAFVSAVAADCGLTDIIPVECACERQISLFKKLGRWQEEDGYVPRPGDIVFYDWQDSGLGDNRGYSDHEGIVESVSGGRMSVIEGNSGDAVQRRSIALNARFIRGFGLPDYGSRAGEDVIILDPEQDETAPGNGSGNTPAVTVPAAGISLALPLLQRGSKGKSVRALQILLSGYGYSTGAYGADGDFGPDTDRALRAFQRDNALDADGIAGIQSWQALLV